MLTTSKFTKIIKSYNTNITQRKKVPVEVIHFYKDVSIDVLPPWFIVFSQILTHKVLKQNLNLIFIPLAISGYPVVV